MTNREMKILSEQLAEQERDIVCYEQAMINFSAMIRDNGFNPAILKHGSEYAEGLINCVYKDIEDSLPRIRKEHAKDDRIHELESEIERLKSRNLWQRIINKL